MAQRRDAKVWEGERPNRLRGLEFEAAGDLLLVLNVAKTLRDLSPLKSVGLHKLEATAESMGDDRERTVADLLEFRKGDLYEVGIVDYPQGLGRCLRSHIRDAF